MSFVTQFDRPGSYHNLPAERKLAMHMRETSFREEPEPTIRLASGKMSKYYIDCKMGLAHAEIRELIGRLIYLMLIEGGDLDSIQGVGGIELGAYPVAIAFSDHIFREMGRDIPVFIVRKQPKGHGLKKFVEGDIKAGDRVLVVEDVITTGGSTAQAIQRCREAGLDVARAIAVVDRMEDRTEPVTVEGLKLESLITLQDILTNS